MTQPTETDGVTGSDSSSIGGAAERAARPRRWWPPVAVPAAVLLVGLAYEFLSYSHTLAGHVPAVVVSALLAVAIVIALVDRRLPLFGQLAIGTALAIGILFAVTQLRVPADPLIGEWNVTFGAPSTVVITTTPDGYTMTATSPLRVHTSATCDLPPGTVIATFTGSPPKLTGRMGLWYTQNCQFAQWSATTFTLGEGTIDTVNAQNERFILTRAR